MSNVGIANRRLLALNPTALAQAIKTLGKDIGFSEVRITHPSTERAAVLLKRWQDLNNAGEMHYLQRHGLKRGHIHTIAPDALSIISVSLNYLSEPVPTLKTSLDTDIPYISVYARNRDYHKLMRKMLARFAKAIEQLTEAQLKTRAFVDTAPVLDKAYAEQSGIGWVGKHTNILDRHHGSFYFLGELAVNLKLPVDYRVRPRCGSCRACIDVCPTQAITAPYQLDAERCISYLTIEYNGIISDTFKKAIGNRIYGCDDCQIFCPWNKYAKMTPLADFYPRKVFKNMKYLDLFLWDEETFLRQTEGSPIRRIGHARWQRNLAIAMANQHSVDNRTAVLTALTAHRTDHVGCREAVQWAIKSLI